MQIYKINFIKIALVLHYVKQNNKIVTHNAFFDTITVEKYFS